MRAFIRIIRICTQSKVGIHGLKPTDPFLSRAHESDEREKLARAKTVISRAVALRLARPKNPV